PAAAALALAASTAHESATAGASRREGARSRISPPTRAARDRLAAPLSCSWFPLDPPMPISTVYRLMNGPTQPPAAATTATFAAPTCAAGGDPAQAPCFAPPLAPPSERRAWIIACSTGALGVLVLVAVLTGLV